MQVLNRRQLLIQGGLLLGVSLTPLSKLALAAIEDSQSGSGHTFLSGSLKTTLAIITDIIIPATDTPGAVAAGVPDFIEQMLSRCVHSMEAQEWLAEFRKFQLESGFNALSKEQQLAAVKSLDEQLGQVPFYSTIKELTLVGYYTSEIGGSVELQHDPVPGPYNEIPLKNIARAWS
ncbi:gluconate 2-dehydrogenase subunit 3 family protein [Planctobacterium marinum]|uniref:gluconate 2-dehydrogenase subunit 3 family protein n=1 Tax=Planctobacterium marinum TaxID=1631968 RepID=UPI001E2B120D|nr:gluconate 2-dehydrogenase subunit 3 family protein [Planctobacterium marinum]MCC2606548.1 gluconate 2-dehydrogenase subunit 3 family protein [Planctobacterium marinum]